MSLGDDYKTLCVNQNDSFATIRSSYSALLKRHHPDLVDASDSSSDKVNAIKNAYDKIRSEFSKHCHILNVGLNADFQEIKISYYKLSGQYEIASNAGDLEAKVKYESLKNAYEFLANKSEPSAENDDGW